MLLVHTIEMLQDGPSRDDTLEDIHLARVCLTKEPSPEMFLFSGEPAAPQAMGGAFSIERVIGAGYILSQLINPSLESLSIIVV